MKSFPKIALAAVLSLGFAFSLTAVTPTAVLSEIKGKVEIKAPGATVWTPASVGMVIVPQAVISTGFDSGATITIDRNSIFVKPLTRISLDKLVEESGTVSTSVFLRVGNARSSVKSAEGVKQDFQVSSPYSTASVRGTEFNFNGLSLDVIEGIVAFYLGRPNRPGADASDYAGAPDVEADENAITLVSAGESIIVSGNGNVSYSVDESTLIAQTTIQASGSTRPDSGSSSLVNAPSMGSVTVTWKTE